MGILDDGKGPFQYSLSDIGRKQILGKEPMLESSDQSCSKYLPAIISDGHKQWVLKLEFLKQDFGAKGKVNHISSSPATVLQFFSCSKKILPLAVVPEYFILQTDIRPVNLRDMDCISKFCHFF